VKLIAQRADPLSRHRTFACHEGGGRAKADDPGRVQGPAAKAPLMATTMLNLHKPRLVLPTDIQSTNTWGAMHLVAGQR
jgi:hypothetical protein